jgi:ATP/maltotriose-dependent transcriptional regulator MalT
MTMSFLLHDSLSEMDPTDIMAAADLSPGKKGGSHGSRVTVIEDKLKIPQLGNVTSRKRLLDLLCRSTEQYGATLISGRAGTGKTALAAEYADQTKNSSWITIEPADSDWREFSAAFSACLFGSSRARLATIAEEPDDAVISKYLTECFSRLAKHKRPATKLIVLDNVHHLFDARWFADFFRQLIISLNENIRLLMLCRSTPSAPLWRLRSKQMLNVIDENLLDLTDDEAMDICRMRGISDSRTKDALNCSFRRVSAFLKELDRAAA